MKRFFIVAGDPSGDLVASQLVASLKKLDPQIHITGVGGVHLQKVSDEFLINIVHQGAFGVAITPGQILFFRKVLNEVIEPALRKNRPEAVIPVDFYGFNSRVAKLAKQNGTKVFYYASPQFWATRPGRADSLRAFVDLFLCLFPFEIDFYKKRQLPAQFVGHPILDVIPEVPDDIPARVESMVGLLPGSRLAEIKRHLPVMMKACDKISSVHPGTRYVLFTVPHVDRTVYQDIIAQSGRGRCLIELIQDENYTWRAQLDMAMTASGMESLENAMLGIPMVVLYKTNWLTYGVGKLLIRIPNIAMPNLLAGRKIIPEFLQWTATPDALADPLLEWMNNPRARKDLRAQLLSLRRQFGENGASERAARVILEKVA